jgi:type I restriction enzyme, R subunit
MSLNKATIEAATLEWFEGLGYVCTNDLLIAPSKLAAKPDSLAEVALVGRLRKAIWRLNLAVLEAAPANIRQNRIMQLERSANP